MKYVVSFWHEKDKTWGISGIFDKLEDAFGAQRELCRDFLVVSEWVETRITRLRGY